MRLRGLRLLGALVVGALILAGASCPVGPGTTGVVDRSEGAAEPVTLTYLGVGGWIFERGGAQLLAAPLFSNPSLLRTGLAPIAADTAAIDAGLAPYDLSGARAILVGHGHYDHLMDVPRVAEHHAPAARILGSSTVRNLLGSWSGMEDRVEVVDGWEATAERPGRWIPLGKSLRVLPLRSEHAPHFEGVTLYEGTADVPRREAPGQADEWLDGPTYAYLVDFLDGDGSVAFRVYYQDAVAPAPAGFAPEALMEERPVDVAILVPATFDQVDWHPEAFVANLRPRWVLLGHWESFFVPPSDPTRSVFATDMPHFEARLDRVLDGEFWRPEIGTTFHFPPS